MDVLATVATDKDELIAELLAAIAARDEFIAIAAHELRNPLTPVVGQVQMLLGRARRDGAERAMIDGLERLELAVQHYLSRATSLLEISRLNAGQQRQQTSSFDIATLVRDIARHFELLAHRAGSALRCDADGPVIGTWDRLSTEQILDNLVSNAIRYGDGQPIEIALQAGPDDVVVSVTDHGPGISPQDQHRIFGRFEQAVTSGRRSGGFGLGLWLVRQLAEAQNGTIEVTSAIGTGSTFKVRLPRHFNGVAMTEQPK